MHRGEAEQLKQKICGLIDSMTFKDRGCKTCDSVDTCKERYRGRERIDFTDCMNHITKKIVEET